jgi:uncharacterized Ntn-hydrolase superfamily protein
MRTISAEQARENVVKAYERQHQEGVNALSAALERGTKADPDKRSHLAHHGGKKLGRYPGGTPLGKRIHLLPDP